MALPPQPIGSSESFMALMDRVSDVAALEKPVLIAGERGTGKELIASRLHFLSPRWEQIFVSVNCAAFTADALDHELFGDSFLDGRDDTNGRFFEANNGTLFLDAVHTLPLYLQEKLMQVIEYGRVQATGELYAEDVDVRVVAATSVDLPAAVARGEFRADLLDRLAFHVVTLPPLRARKDDIPVLGEHFGKRIARALGADSFPGFTAEAMEALYAYPFPGNVRELRFVVERSTAKSFLRDETLTEPIDDLEFDPFDSPYRIQDTLPAAPIPSVAMAASVAMTAPIAPSPHQIATVTPPVATETPPNDPIQADATFTDRVMAFERRLIDEAMRVTKDHQGKAAERLGLSYHQFRGLLRKHGLKK